MILNSYFQLLVFGYLFVFLFVNLVHLSHFFVIIFRLFILFLQFLQYIIIFHLIQLTSLLKIQFFFLFSRQFLNQFPNFNFLFLAQIFQFNISISFFIISRRTYLVSLSCLKCQRNCFFLVFLVLLSRLRRILTMINIPHI